MQSGRAPEPNSKQRHQQFIQGFADVEANTAERFVPVSAFDSDGDQVLNGSICVVGIDLNNENI